MSLRPEALLVQAACQGEQEGRNGEGQDKKGRLQMMFGGGDVHVHGQA